MAVFIIVATRNAAGIEAAIRAENLSCFALKSEAWLVAWDGGTSRELAEKLKIRGGESGSGLVCLIGGYSGRLPRDAWEWLDLHEGKL